MASTFEQIPGVGRSLARDIESLGYTSIDELRGVDPESMYQRLRDQAGGKMDRCVLYVFRCSVYYAEGGRDAEKLKWWNWKP